ncbi:Rha family transcriptional regulator, partial [Escherichia coli]|nr:Rha family transcriptional regulator [Escherichia coli]EEZ3370995.1 Rha family transcriptional regulator [Escherichia coli]EIH2576365.1 Rha family transcriptional regulator [Escherichia coli]
MNHQLANLDFRDMVVVSGDRVITTSRKVAAYFDKQHHHIIQKIEKLDCSDEFLTSNFSRVTYEHKGNQYVEYEISKDGAMYIIMSFTGKKAAAIKEAFIKAFNWMRDRLMEMAH